MNLPKGIKGLLIGGVVLTALVWLASDTSSQSQRPPLKPQNQNAKDYVGTEVCKACHEDQFKAFSHTSHARLESISSWKEKVTGCEACHGPGREHVETGDPTKIVSFKNRSPKETSETCLGCHAGREEHNNFRRGEHWRNDIGCTECHSSHTPDTGRHVATSNVFVTDANAQKPGYSTTKLLKMNEPQLCISCHGETKHQFNLPFHHKVFEGAMRCSDCHNPHGGFELKQTRLATGADAACIKCHADKQGPFVYEHAPVKTDGCVSCHTPHGSANPRLLITSRVAQLCLTCHSTAHGVGAEEPAGPQHNLNAQYANCTNCHIKIHGSHTSPVFFR
ncbi:MAG TPA: DmsE family decaheme c-type cytochrome [Pyrinomonadaceae bacterium]|nr:DmsE family decaheme c-type cytochrome [Pyrinomonadaceae bacterium]